MINSSAHEFLTIAWGAPTILCTNEEIRPMYRNHLRSFSLFHCVINEKGVKMHSDFVVFILTFSKHIFKYAVFEMFRSTDLIVLSISREILQARYTRGEKLGTFR